jgi:hypothetical protein
MQRSAHFLAAASLAIAGLSFCTPANAADKPQNDSNTAQRDKSKQSGQQGQANPGGEVIVRDVVIYGALVPEGQPQSSPAGFSQIQLKDGPAIRDTITKLTDAVLDNSASTKLLDCLTDKDQQRLQKDFKPGDQGLKQALSQVRQTWKQKYNKEFDPKQEMASFGHDFTIVEGQVSNPKLLSDWPVPQPERSGQGENAQQGNTSHNATGQGQAGNPARADSGQANKGAAANQNGQGDQSGQANHGEQFAVIVFPASQEYPETNVSLLKQGNEWKIDVPKSIDGAKLEQNLTHALQQISQSKNLPQDQKMAYQQISHAIFAAMYDQQPLQNGQQQQGQANQQQGQQPHAK